MNDEQQALDAGIDGTDPAKAREHADVKRWFKRFDAARKFDEQARKQYAIDRRYARGDSGFEVDANVIGTNIDILEAFLYAKNPDIDVVPAVAVEPPDQDSLMDAARMAERSYARLSRVLRHQFRTRWRRRERSRTPADRTPVFSTKRTRLPAATSEKAIC